MENQDLKESVLVNLRSVAQSSKGGVPFDRLQRDYRDLLGNNIPFRDLGYNSLEAFIRDIPHVISLRKNHDGQLMAQGVADETTAHIVSLVSRQKPAKTYGRGSRRSHVVARRGYSSKYTSRGTARHSSFTSRASYVSQSSSSVQSPHRVLLQTPRQKTPPLKSTSKQQISTNTNQHSRPQTPPFKAEEASTARKYEIAPRFLRLQEAKRKAQATESLESTFTSDNSTSVNNSQHDTRLDIPRPLSIRNAPIRTERLNELLDSSTTAKEYVANYAKMNNISVHYSTMVIGQKQKNKGYITKLMVGDKIHKSYPDVASSEAEAEEKAAKVAMEAIKSSKEHFAVLPETSISSPQEIQILLTRIEEIVCEKPSGMFTHGLVMEYENKFNETLPKDWLNLLKESSILDIDRLDVPYGRVPDGVNFIVRLAKGVSSGSLTPSSTSSKAEQDFDVLTLNKTLDTLTLNKTLDTLTMNNNWNNFPRVPPIAIPAGNEWFVYITNVSGLMAARLFDYYEEFLNLSEAMKLSYQARNFPVTEVFVNNLYAACDDENPEIWHRVLVHEIREDGLIECYFVDEGEFLSVKKSNLQELTISFRELPYQAILISLEGLEDYEPYMKPEHLSSLLGQKGIALVKRWWAIPDFFPNNPEVHKTAYSVVLYDTEQEEDVNLNEEIKNVVMDSLICKLPKLSSSSCAYLTHVTPSGEIYLRLLHPQESWLEIELEKLSPLFEEADKSLVLPSDQVCAAKYEDGRWYRAVVLKELFSTEAQMFEVFFIDYGHTSIVEKSGVTELKTYSEMLSSLKNQAIKCELYDALPTPDAKWTEAATQKLLEMAAFSEELIIRVICEGDDKNLAKVNLYKRNEDFDIISINHTLACRPDLFHIQPSAAGLTVTSKLNLSLDDKYHATKCSLSSVIPDVAVPAEEMAKKLVDSSPAVDFIDWVTTPDNIKSPDMLEDKSPVPLKSPEVPDKGQDFDVFVTLAANPMNFIVQPLATCAETNTLMSKMQQFYSSEENFCEMHSSLLKQNDFYAALHNDKLWYRVRLERVIFTEPITAAVHYVDFGDFNTVLMSNLQPLWKEFRYLPCQAIKASLAEVKPLEKDWDPVQCFKFKEMVNEKKFVSIIKDKRFTREEDLSSLELQLILIDTTDPTKDVYIHELLIEKKIAQHV